ncbi:4-alpha-glucanotransferase DPE2-like isoform X5 [Henckelia pumila]|uniref:4-alpha-glucanotransferase DPE2-like isoform X5 n=1 Tax=Henckelia pumila TaxID=405737 RepID=UPI003C6E3D70
MRSTYSTCGCSFSCLTSPNKLLIWSCLENSMLLESEEKLQRSLFDLLQNIVLIRDPEDSKKFYPRLNLEDTSSFSDLDEHSARWKDDEEEFEWQGKRLYSKSGALKSFRPL